MTNVIKRLNKIESAKTIKDPTKADLKKAIADTKVLIKEAHTINKLLEKNFKEADKTWNKIFGLIYSEKISEDMRDFHSETLDNLGSYIYELEELKDNYENALDQHDGD